MKHKMSDEFDELSFKTKKQEKLEDKKEEVKVEKEKPCFEQSGILAEFQNQYQGVVLKFTEPLDAAVPQDQWKVYPFKGEEELKPVNISRKSCYLFGRDSKVADILLENPSCSSQHAVIQFREKQVTRQLSIEEQTARGIYMGIVNEMVIRPYLMDLESTNKTFLNNEAIEPARYYELREKDLIKFGESTREYVIMKA
eukprot:403354774